MKYEVESKITWSALAITFIAGVAFLFSSSESLVQLGGQGALGPFVEQIVFTLLACMMLYGSLVYILCRLGYIKRKKEHIIASEYELESFAFDTPAKPAVFYFLHTRKTNGSFFRR